MNRPRVRKILAEILKFWNVYNSGRSCRELDGRKTVDRRRSKRRSPIPPTPPPAGVRRVADRAQNRAAHRRPVIAGLSPGMFPATCPRAWRACRTAQPPTPPPRKPGCLPSPRRRLRRERRIVVFSIIEIVAAFRGISGDPFARFSSRRLSNGQRIVTPRVFARAYEPINSHCSIPSAAHGFGSARLDCLRP